MIYRGYNIRKVDAIDLQRRNQSENKMELCDGVYVEIYDQSDDGLTERIGDTTFAVGYEIPDLRKETIEKAIREYVDEHILGLDCIRNEVLAERKNHLVGRLVSWIGEEQSGEALYNTLSDYIGMTDDEIRQCGFKTLVPFFNQEEYAKTIAAYMVFVGTDNTTTGHWNFAFEEIGERFGVNLSEDGKMLNMITEELNNQTDALSDIDVYCNEFDLSFYLDHCPYVDKEEHDNTMSPGEMDDVQGFIDTCEIAMDYGLGLDEATYDKYNEAIRLRNKLDEQTEPSGPVLSM